jgi:3-methyladenine DNA glycosylase AlkD
MKTWADLGKEKFEEATIAIQWVGELSKQYEKEDFRIFENWLKKYIDNWGKDDDFCLHIIHPMIEKYPELIYKVKSWSHSKNMWLRRASAVSFITTIGAFYMTKHNLKDIFEVAETLLHDKEDLVQKGYGWMLKSSSIHNQKEVFEFVMKHKVTMPRTALRYAIEKMPTNLKKQVMN